VCARSYGQLLHSSYDACETTLYTTRQQLDLCLRIARLIHTALYGDQQRDDIESVSIPLPWLLYLYLQRDIYIVLDGR
jgi:hypothetical protein